MNVRLSARFSALLFAATAAAGAANCKSFDHERLHSDVEAAAGEVEKLLAEKRWEDAYALYHPIHHLEPNNPKVRGLWEKFPAEAKDRIERKKWMGTSKLLHPDADAGFVRHALWYIPDRIRDLFNIFTVEVNVGPQIGAGLHATQAMQAVAYSGATAGLGTYQKQIIGVRSEASTELNIGPVGTSHAGGAVAGAGGLLGMHHETQSGSESTMLHRPSQDIYQDYRDYWSVGGKAGLGIAGTDVQMHLLEIPDFVLGFFFVDFLKDDHADTEDFSLNFAQERLLDSVSVDSDSIAEAHHKKYP